MSLFAVNSNERYQKLEKIGDGAYGVVYKAKDLMTGEIVAMKKNKMDIHNDGIPTSCLREVATLRELNHSNILKIINIQLKNEHLYMIFEYLQSDLKTYLDSFDEKNKLSPTVVKSIIFGIIKGLNECHTKKIIHRDLKPQNILLSSNNIPKIGDFGLARPFQKQENQFTQEVVTLWYRAPELILGETVYSTAIDIWSVGCIFAELITRQPLFKGDSEIDQLFQIFKILGTPNSTTWPNVENLPNYRANLPQWKKNSLEFLFESEVDYLALDLLEKMLELDPKKRINATSALSHEYFKDFSSK